MSFPIIRPTDFTSILDIFVDPTTVFIIPSFQRPFAWGHAQLDDLLDDMRKARANKGSHYLSALHLTEISSSDLSCVNRSPDTLSIGDFLDLENPHIDQLITASMNNSLRTPIGQPLKLYAVA